MSARPTDGFDYPDLLRRAILGVARNVLAQVAETGLPGEHHFYLTFRTRHPGVVVPQWLASQHPAEMTIVLQNQFESLAVDESGFSVTLRFSGRLTRLTVPWDALVAWADPSVGFGMRLAPEVADTADSAASPKLKREDSPRSPTHSGGAAGGSRGVVDIASFRRGDRPDGAS